MSCKYIRSVHSVNLNTDKGVVLIGPGILRPVEVPFMQPSGEISLTLGLVQVQVGITS